MDTMHPQNLINTGAAWHLEGTVGRACMAAIEDGAAILGPTGHRDFWGNYVPSRDEVELGTKGSVGYANALLTDYLGADPGFTADDFDSGRAYQAFREANDEQE